MKKDNWRFEALARAKIVRQEEEERTIKADLLEACKDAYKLIALTRPDTCGYVLVKLSDAIAKAERKE